MKESRRQRCLAVCRMSENDKHANLVDQAAGFADEWYSANPMPCGSNGQDIADSYHTRCRAHVEQSMRCAVGLLTLLTIIYYLTQICYTVWRWRLEAGEQRHKQAGEAPSAAE